jgi:hypothetical protein
MNTPVVASGTTVGRFTVACPWCGTLNIIVNVQRPLGAERPEKEGR